jgi:tripartite-type tricarboxylate transporter receptor subunit TctC
LKAIAITGDGRAPALPEVPTFSEAGLPGFHSQGWFGIVAPAATPKNAINKMSSEMASILAMPDTREYLIKQGSEAFVSTPEQVNALIKADVAKYAKIIKSANIKLEY